MRADMDFPQDQVVLFKAFGPDGEVAARYSVFTDFGFGTIDNVTAGECHKRGEDKFIYFYDTTNVKSRQRNSKQYGVLTCLEAALRRCFQSK